MKRKSVFATLVAVVFTFVLVLSGCGGEIDSSDEVDYDSQAATTSSPFQEVYDAGIAKYAGSASVKPTSNSTCSGIVTYHYDVTKQTGRGPICMRGAEFNIEARDGSFFHNQLLIFLEGGGVCLNEVCGATSEPILTLSLMQLGGIIGIGGILDKDNSDNPAKNYNVVHIPYCDGSVFMGDVDRVLSDGDDSNGTQDMAYQRGLQNLTAGFEIAKLRYPNPARVVLAGTSGGSYGIVAATALARYYYPNKEIVVIADSGAPILRDNEKDFVRSVLTQINAIQYVPQKTCPDCIVNGHVTKIIDWALRRDAKLRIAYMSHANDAVIGDFFMNSPPPVFATAAIRETATLAAAWPKRFHRFITVGTSHTYLLNVGVVPDWMQEAVLGMFGSLFLVGIPNASDVMSTWAMGDLGESGTDQKGKRVNGYQWVKKFLDNSIFSPCVDVVNQ